MTLAFAPLFRLGTLSRSFASPMRMAASWSISDPHWIHRMQVAARLVRADGELPSWIVPSFKKEATGCCFELDRPRPHARSWRESPSSDSSPQSSIHVQLNVNRLMCSPQLCGVEGSTLGTRGACRPPTPHNIEQASQTLQPVDNVDGAEDIWPPRGGARISGNTCISAWRFRSRSARA
jgi:hypothetical protein